MAKFVEKRKEIEAIQFVGTLESINAIQKLTDGDAHLDKPKFGRQVLTIRGAKRRKDGKDIILKNGEFITTTIWADVFDIYTIDEFHEKWEPKKENE